jgi:hypothetical protein
MNIIIISGQRTALIDSLYSGPWPGTRLTKKINILIGKIPSRDEGFES